MQRKVVFLPSTGMLLDELGKSAALQLRELLLTPSLAESLLASTKYQGFPIVRSRIDLTLLGDIARSDLLVTIGSSALLLLQ